MSKTPEELNELKHEYVSLCSKFEELDDEALEKFPEEQCIRAAVLINWELSPGTGSWAVIIL